VSDFDLDLSMSGVDGGDGGGGELDHLLSGLRSGDESTQLICVGEVAEYLAMANEETMSSFPVDPFVSALVALLRIEHNPEIMLLAMRALCHMIEAQPQAAGTIASSGAVEMIVEKIVTMQYIDLAEQAIVALEKVYIYIYIYIYIYVCIEYMCVLACRMYMGWIAAV
jgi:E3 ubiquitin-protein ligase TRIP12